MPEITLVISAPHLMSSISLDKLMAAMVGPTVPMQQNLVQVLQVLGELQFGFKLREASMQAITCLLLKLPGTDLQLSVQTAAHVTHYPEVVCETALLHGDGLVYVDALGYSDVCKWRLDEFKAHLLDLTAQVKGKKYADFEDESKKAEEVPQQ